MEELEQEVKQAQQEHAAVVAEQEANKAEFEKTVAAYRQTNIDKNFSEAIRKTGIAWYDASPIPMLLTDTSVGGFRIEWSNNGEHYKVVDKDGRPVDSLETALEQFAVSHEFLANPDTTQHLTKRDPNTGQFQTLAKSDFANVAQRSRFIEANGIDAFERLPLRHEKPTPLHSMTGAEYSRLSPAQKSEIIKQIGEAGVALILKRK